MKKGMKIAWRLEGKCGVEVGLGLGCGREGEWVDGS